MLRGLWPCGEIYLEDSNHKGPLMSVSRKPIHYTDDFDRAQILTTTPGHNGWTLNKTGAGTPIAAIFGEDGGAMRLECDATAEVQVVGMDHDNILTVSLEALQRSEMICRVAAISVESTIIWGFGSAQDDTPDSITTAAWFRIEGAASLSNVVVETRGGAIANVDVATAETLGAVYKKFEIDLMRGLKDVRFFIDGERVAPATTFDLSGITAGQNVQPIMQVQKTSSTAVPQFDIARVDYTHSYVYGE